MAVAVVKTEPAAGSEGSLSFSSSSHLQNSRSLSDTLAAEFQRCLADQTFVDVRLYGGLAESVRCHKVVLAAFSGVLAAALADAEDAASDDETAVIIPDMSLDDLTSVVEFVYYRSLTLQAGENAGGMPRPSLMEWLAELGICGEEELERALERAPYPDVFAREELASKLCLSESRCVVCERAPNDMHTLSQKGDFISRGQILIF